MTFGGVCKVRLTFTYSSAMCQNLLLLVGYWAVQRPLALEYTLALLENQKATVMRKRNESVRDRQKADLEPSQ